MKIAGTSPTTINFDDAFDGGMLRSLYARFAMLQHKMSESSKNFALSKMKQIENSQAEQKRVAQMLQDLRKAQGDSTTEKDGKAVGSGSISKKDYDAMKKSGMAVPELTEQHKGVNLPGFPTSSAASKIDGFKMARDYAAKLTPPEMSIQLDESSRKLLKELGIALPPESAPAPELPKGRKPTLDELGEQLKQTSVTLSFDTLDHIVTLLETRADQETTYTFTTKELDMMVQSAQAYLDQIGTNTQQVMVEIQDAMGQYNSLTQGCKSAIDKGNELLGVTARVS